jgi:hypothetical protein
MFSDFWTDSHRPDRPVQTDMIRFKLSKIDLTSFTIARPPHPINTGCHRWLSATNSIKTNQNSPIFILSHSTLVLPLSTPNSVPTLTYYSFFIPAAIEGILAGLSMPEQIQSAPSPTGSLPSRSLLDFRGDPWKLVWSVAYTGLIDRLIQRPARLICGPRMSRCFGVWPVHTSTHFLMTPLGTKKRSSTTMADDKGNLSEVNSRIIITAKLEELPEES